MKVVRQKKAVAERSRSKSGEEKIKMLEFRFKIFKTKD
jgi:hypothetical protein